MNVKISNIKASLSQALQAFLKCRGVQVTCEMFKGRPVTSLRRVESFSWVNTIWMVSKLREDKE